MDIQFPLNDTLFEWDSEKADTNLSKHRISFEIACQAFFDPFFYVLDAGIVDGKEREAVIGMTVNWRLLYVVYTLRRGYIRIVSARLATRHERRVYEEQ